MRASVSKTVTLGELVVAAFDRAALRSTDPVKISRLAAHAVTYVLERALRRRATVSSATEVRLVN